MAALNSFTDPRTRGSERRGSQRLVLESLSYVELGANNGGVILNLCDGGLAMRAAIPVMDNKLPPLRFHLANVQNWFEVEARITWKADENRTIGLEFMNLPAAQREQINAWISGQAIPAGSVVPIAEEPPAPKIAEKLRIPTSLYAPPRVGNDRPRTPLMRPGDMAAMQPTAIYTPPALRGVTGAAGATGPVALTSVNVKLPDPATLQANGAANGNGAGKSAANGAASANGAGAVSVAAHVAPAADAAAGASASAAPKDAAPSAAAIRSAVVGTSLQPSLARRAATAILPVRDEGRGAWILVPVVVIFSVLFVVAGWTAGRGGVDALRAIFSSSASAPASDTQPVNAAAAPSDPIQIEVVDADGRSRAIAWDGQSVANAPAAAAGKSQQASRRQSTASSPNEGRTNEGHSASQSVSRVQPPASAPVGSRAGINSSSLNAAVNVGSKQQELVPETGAILKRVEPIYPQDAIDAHVEGIVELQAIISTDGHVRDVRVLSGHKDLVPAAVTAVRQWRFEPAVADGRLVESRQNVRLTFRLGSEP